MEIVIVGGAGFIGLNLIEELIAHTQSGDWSLTVVDSGTYASDISKCSSILGHLGCVVVDDIVDLQPSTELILHNADVIINLAAETHVDNSILDASEFIDTNIIGTYNLLELVKGGKCSRYMQISTDEVYGSLSIDDSPSTETSVIAPNSPYSASKASADLLVRSYVKTHNVPAIITRCCNNFGKYQNNEKLIPKMIESVLNYKPLTIYGDGSNIREWIDVRDHCRAIINIMLDGTIGEVYNIGSGYEKSNIDIAKDICIAMNYPQSNIEFIEDRKGHDFRYSLNSNKIKDELNFKVKYQYSTTLFGIIDWYKLNNL